jgi:cell division septation protein DedD
MEDNSKLFVFDKKEVILIFVFMLLITITSFTLGVRFGKSISLKVQGYTPKDVATIDLKSVEEERVDKLTGDDKFEGAISSAGPTDSARKNGEASEKTSVATETESEEYLKETELRIREEINKLANPQENSSADLNKKKVNNLEEEVSGATPNPAQDKFDDIYQTEVRLSGKYTIQLASFESKQEAQSFADGFIASGYDAIINEVQIPQKGVWYRVSIGLFESLNDAKDYLQKEQQFFQGKDYLIKKFK